MKTIRLMLSAFRPFDLYQHTGADLIRALKASGYKPSARWSR